MYKLTCIGLVALLLLLQYQFWQQYGKVRQLQRAVDAQVQQNDQLTKRNAELVAEVEDLRAGDQAIEERARSQLGLINKDEQFIQLIPPSLLEQTGQVNDESNSEMGGDIDNAQQSDNRIP